ncbi:MAG TPA: hypothetical protein VEX36_10490 [Thermoleophilaceae bacterium]|nr:hypothetical protein [Thermoleophilaceae bacterium]
MSKRHDVDLPEDPTGIDQPHDVLAAEEFAMPARSAGDIPPDPTGIQEPHDTLAAEEFAMPTAGVDHSGGGGLEARSFVPLLGIAFAMLLALRVLRRRRD